jgi:voltage-gated sodium channel
MSRFAKNLVDSKLFQSAIIAVILFAGVLAGLETNAALVERHGLLLRVLDATVLAVFTAEIALKIAAQGRRPLAFFRDGWNVFDFTIVALCLLPIGGPFAAVLRLVRVLRLLRLVTALPKLQLLVGALLKSLGSMGYVSVLLGLIFYIYAVAGVHLFGRQMPEHFGSMPVAMMSLFQIITLDNWSDLFNPAQAVAPIGAGVYFVSFILLGTMILLNLFIGIVMNSMAEMHAELDYQQEAARDIAEQRTVLGELTTLERQLDSVKSRIKMLRARLPQSSP